jgi:hypothetical protein
LSAALIASAGVRLRPAPTLDLRRRGAEQPASPGVATNDLRPCPTLERRAVTTAPTLDRRRDAAGLLAEDDVGGAAADGGGMA